MKFKQLLAFMLYIPVLLVLLSLGSWQTMRGLEKKQVEGRIDSLAHKYITLERRPLDWQAVDFSNARLQGSWLTAQQFFRDNRVYRGQHGVEVYTPFRLLDGAVVLVNRGWHPGTIDALKLAQPEDSSVVGKIYLPQKGYTIGPAYTEQKAWPRLIQYFEVEQLSQAFGQPLEPVLMVLTDRTVANVLTPIWQPVTVPAVRHYGYAFQWFSLTLVWLVMGVIWLRSRPKRQ